MYWLNKYRVNPLFLSTSTSNGSAHPVGSAFKTYPVSDDLPLNLCHYVISTLHYCNGLPVHSWFTFVANNLFLMTLGWSCYQTLGHPYYSSPFLSSPPASLASLFLELVGFSLGLRFHHYKFSIYIKDDQLALLPQLPFATCFPALHFPLFGCFFHYSLEFYITNCTLLSVE